jgi:hypothetical protein
MKQLRLRGQSESALVVNVEAVQLQIAGFVIIAKEWVYMGGVNVYSEYATESNMQIHPGVE